MSKKLKQYYSDLRDQIDWEGGIYDCLVMHGYDSGVDEELDELVGKLEEAHNLVEMHLNDKYEELGIEQL